MEIVLADNHGFCPGVRQAVQKALKTLKKYGTVYSLGDLIHNRLVVDELGRQGLKVIDDISQVPEDGVLLIRSHGVSPAVFAQARERGLTIVDATCGLVRRAQKIVAELSEQSYHVVVIGDADHPEVRGLIGYGNCVTVISKAEDINQLPKSARLGVVAQTTISPDYVVEMVSRLIHHGFGEIRLVNTLCDQVIGRQQSAITLARKVDIMFVLGGLHSANTRHLAELCQHAGVRTYHLESFDQFQPEMVESVQTVGITAGASTPDNLIEEFVTKLRKVASDGQEKSCR